MKDPIGNLFSGGGLTFYGGLIVGGGLDIFYLRKHTIDFRHFADAIAPALMLAYGIGRLGCYFSGDGDWGIFNSAYYTVADGSLKMGSSADYYQAVTQSPGYFTDHFGTPDHVRNLFAPAPAWYPSGLLPTIMPTIWLTRASLWQITGDYCLVLPVAVFPASLYEAVVCTLLFGVLWVIRKRMPHPYICSGSTFIHPTQSVIISTLLIVAGLVTVFLYKKRTTPLNIGK